MRVIAGIAKGRTLDVPRGGGTRSATDRIRETLFAILEPILGDARVLDLFAGAGTLGIEALSRGSASVTFVERSAEALKALRKNIASTGFDDRAEVVAANVLAFLEQQVAGPYDVVFCDPPFADVAILEATLAHPRLAGALAPEAHVVARVLRKHQPRVPVGARVLRVKEIGEETLLFLRYDGVRGGG
ncbi:MAG TPA: 16S rRNA (guanine(966)-N(2))-methyltransferase RsmD [Candidatus Limnocylindria bacterium]|nr:16S rRNA (guanine(966)-N(2))-methyltransferase RsmD [Candidatus Limnocylindria bacterium]